MNITKTDKNIKLVAIFLLLAFILGLTSCGFSDEYSGDPAESRPSLNSAEDADVSGEDGKTESMKRFESLENYDYSGKKFVIVTTDEELFKTNSQTLVGKAVNQRNELVVGKFDVELEIKVESPEEILENARYASRVGKHYADLVVAPASVLSALMNEKLLLNLNVLPYLEVSDEALYNDSQINGKNYLLFGSLTQVENSSWCVFYNGVASSSLGVDPYELYKKGEWTWEAFQSFAEGVLEQYENGFVSTATKEELVNVFWGATGNKFFGNCSETALAVPKIENGKSILSSIRKLLQSNSYGKVDGTSALELFIDGKSGMLLCRRNAVYTISDSKMDWKAVPLPTYSAESENVAFIDSDTLAAAVPSGVEDTAFIGRILSALELATTATVVESAEKNELYYYWDSNKTAVMMQDVKKNIHLDIGYIYASAVKDIATVTTENIASSLEAGIAPFQFYHSTKRQFELYAKEYFG